MPRKLDSSRRRRRSFNLPHDAVLKPLEPGSHEAFALRLQHLIDRAGSVLALADAIEVSDTAVHYWLKESEPSREKLILLAEKTGVSIEWLVAGTGPVEPAGRSPRGFVMPAQIGRMRGLPPLAFAEGFWALIAPGAFPDNLDNLVSMYISGDVMKPTLQHGDLVLIDITNKQKVDGGIVAISDDRGPLIRRVQHQPGGGVLLVCDNALYPPTEAQSDLEILGQVIWRGGIVSEVVWRGGRMP